jgi:glycosyltransferase involved in cell wall biosynthesis
LNILLFWFHNDWGRFGRTYEKTAIHLARLPEIGHVVCMFPPENSGLPTTEGRLLERRISSKLTLLTERRPAPIGKPEIKNWFSARLDAWLNDRALRKHLIAHNFTSENTLLWLFPPHPYIERLLELVPHRFVVTQVMDNFTHFDKSHWLYPYAVDQYPKIGRWSDIIFTTSESNREEFEKTGKPCYRFHQAVDESFIAPPSDLPFRTSGQAPRLGYLGFIMDRTDLEILHHIAMQRPEWHIILAGPEYPEEYLTKSGLLELPNVEWLGELRNDKAPAFLQSLDICLMPHKDNDYSRSMGPLKLYQYLGSGRPVITTPVAGTEHDIQHLRSARDATQFIDQIQDALLNDMPADRISRIEAARSQTWDIRIREMFDTAVRHMITPGERASG